MKSSMALICVADLDFYIYYICDMQFKDTVYKHL